jgi:hypothetical protein
MEELRITTPEETVAIRCIEGSTSGRNVRYVVAEHTLKSYVKT